jgi:hypothetical protein
MPLPVSFVYYLIEQFNSVEARGNWNFGLARGYDSNHNWKRRLSDASFKSDTAAPTHSRQGYQRR